MFRNRGAAGEPPAIQQTSHSDLPLSDLCHSEFRYRLSLYHAVTVHAVDPSTELNNSKGPEFLAASQKLPPGKRLQQSNWCVERGSTRPPKVRFLAHLRSMRDELADTVGIARQALRIARNGRSAQTLFDGSSEECLPRKRR